MRHPPPVAAIEGRIELPDGQRAGGVPDHGTSDQVPGDAAKANRRRLRFRIAAEQIRDSEQPAGGSGKQHLGIGVAVQHDDVVREQPAGRRDQPGTLRGQRSSGQLSGAVADKQVDIPGQRDTEPWVVHGPGPGVAEESDIQVHHATPGKLLVEGCLILDGMRREHPKPGPAGSHGGAATPLSPLRDGHRRLLPIGNRACRAAARSRPAARRRPLGTRRGRDRTAAPPGRRAHRVARGTCKGKAPAAAPGDSGIPGP